MLCLFVLYLVGNIRIRKERPHSIAMIIFFDNGDVKATRIGRTVYDGHDAFGEKQEMPGRSLSKDDGHGVGDTPALRSKKSPAH